jgi:hypothetical protein
LFDMNKLVTSLEDRYFEMCDEHKNGRLPRPDLTNLPAYFEAGVEFDHEVVEMQAVADYHGLYKTELAHLHRRRPLPADGRIWGPQDIAKAEGASVTSLEFTNQPAKRRKVAAR